jgi:hypothetical protein
LLNKKAGRLNEPPRFFVSAAFRLGLYKNFFDHRDVSNPQELAEFYWESFIQT